MRPVQFDVRILVAGRASTMRDGALDLLRRTGCTVVGTCELPLPTALSEHQADVVLAVVDERDDDSTLAAELASDVRMPLVILCAAVENAGVWLARGVLEAVCISDPPALVAARVENAVRTWRRAEEVAALRAQREALARIHTISAGRGGGAEAMREMLAIAVGVMGFERVSLMAHVVGSEAAYVIAATDAPDTTQFVVAIEKYPEVRAALDSRQPVLLDDAQAHPLTAPIADLLAQVDVRGMAVFPLVWKDTPLGVIMFRKSDVGVAHVRGSRESFARTMADHLAVSLQHGKVMESLRESTTHRMSRVRYEAERRLRTIESLKEHFEAAADSVLILDENGRILFVNKAAESILGFERESVMGTDIIGLVRTSDEPMISRVISRVLAGQNIGAFDLDLLTLSGETICASVTTSTVLGSSGAAVLSFRDVTAQRALESELRHTKEFLEKLVDSTVDAIVAADMRGNIMVFNQGAERIHGYGPKEVIGRIPVWALYGDGVAKQIMRMLRSTQYGGVGRLEQTRREIRNKRGELVPVNMTASVIYQDGREVATVGIFSDLRERIRIEQRLLQAQAKLQMTEKQALVAELAGAAAHELNQPLTSIMGYAELILAKSKSSAPNLRAVQVILDEAERMAEIVKKIGRITKYETKLYVGSTRMLDLDLSAEIVPPESLTKPPEPVPPLIESEDPFENEVTGQVELAELLSKGGRSSQGEDDDDDTNPNILTKELAAARAESEGRDER